MKISIPKASIELLKGDITEQKADIIVNAANSTLLGGGGVDGAIHRKGGPSILEECVKIRRSTYKHGLPAGECVATKAGKLPAKFAIHTVGPIWVGGDKNESEILSRCYKNSLRLADEKRATSIAFPAISGGAYGYPMVGAAEVALSAVKNYFEENNESHISKVFFVLYSTETLHIWKDCAANLFNL